MFSPNIVHKAKLFKGCCCKGCGSDIIIIPNLKFLYCSNKACKNHEGQTFTKYASFGFWMHSDIPFEKLFNRAKK